MRNRFENYINSGYISQFTPTPVDANMLYNVTKERQGYYDQLQAQLANLEPNFNYLKATDYDMGHMNEAQQVKDYYTNVSGDVSKLLQEDNLEGAKNSMLQAIYNKDMKRKIAGMQSAYEMNEANLKSIEGIKNIGDRQLSLSHYYKNRLQGRTLDDFVAGKSNPLASPVLGENPGLDKKMLSIMNAIKADGYTFADGSQLNSVRDPNGNLIYKYRTTTGDIKQIREDEAYNIGVNALLADPEVQQYASAMQQWGHPLYEISEDGKLTGMLPTMIGAGASAVSFRDVQQRSNFINDDLGLSRAKGEIADPYAGSVERPAAKNPNIKTQSKPEDWKVENGKVYKHAWVSMRDGRTGVERKISQWQPYQPSPEEMKSFKEDFVKLINTETNEAMIVSKNSSMIPLGPSANATNYITQEIGDGEILSAMAGFEQSMQNVSWATTAPTDTKVKKPTQLEAKGIHSVQVRETGEDGTVTYKTKKIGEVGDIDFYQGGYTMTHPEYNSGHEVFYGQDAEGNQYEAISNTKNQNPAFGVLDGINKWALSLDTKPHAEPVGNNLYAVSEKTVELSQSTNGTFSTGKTPGITVIMVEATSPQEAVQNYKTKGYNPVTFGQFGEELYKNNAN